VKVASAMFDLGLLLAIEQADFPPALVSVRQR
jgi:hypothetical protein